ncbi:MAG TPA: GDSL-type esterase/lipase family protein [Chitinophagaceae bacterium]
MKKIFRQIGLLLLSAVLLLISCKTKVNEQQEQHPPFWNDIQAFKKEDSISAPPKNAILFIGSSSFTLWQDVQNYFPGYTIINRGFGSSTLLDQIRYVNDIVIPYQPKQVVIYCGENDLAFSDSVTAQMVADRFKQLYTLIREKSKAPVLYISMKPSPSRRHLFQKMREGNMLIMEFISGLDPNAALRSNMDPPPAMFLDVHSLMLDANAEPKSEIFLDDSLHMNAKGYAIWQKAIEPYLLKDLNYNR